MTKNNTIRNKALEEALAECIKIQDECHAACTPPGDADSVEGKWGYMFQGARACERAIRRLKRQP
jgi:hypothetical protein